MLDSGDLSQPVAGVYEELVTQRMLAQMEDLGSAGWKAIDADVSEESSPHVLARHIGQAIGRKLSQLPHSKRVALANQIIGALAADAPEQDISDAGELIADGPRQLLALAEQEAPGVYAIRPLTPLSETALITNSPEDPSLGSELRAELATADRIDLLCAFVKWYGLRVLEDSLRAAQQRGVPIRVITTTYIGATDRHALDRLVRDFGAEVKVNYEIRSTRLHAKAWLFRRNSGFDTAYVGSSNLSKAALLDGLEWNVRLSSVATAAVLNKFEATFDAYWNDSAFERYDPDADGGRLDRALSQASGSGPTTDLKISLSGLEVRPFPHQRDMLERLRVEREVRGRNHNLLVAATGTGKTVMAALDYRNLRRTLGHGNPRLLFVAHRKEILKQSLRTYREVLDDASFGELLYSGQDPREWNHIFASVQSLNLQRLEQLAANHFDIIVIDEFHHATASTYRRVIEHFQPKQLLGLTATPERTDGHNVQDEFFDGRIAAEMRLWEALENDLLCPFHYFGIPDGTDLTNLSWQKGSYTDRDLENIYTGNHARARIVIKQIRDKVSNPGAMRALGFCVTKLHAHFMADVFRKSGFQAVALDSDSSAADRAQALTDLRDGKIQVIFSVDLFNEGLDIPDVDTLLLLRPTSSATVFLQQLGRGLRRTETKPVLTVLDFIGQHRAEFRFEQQFRALTNLSRNRLIDHIEHDFPQLPSGCQIILEGKSKDLVLDNIRTQIGATVKTLVKEVQDYRTPRLADYLRESRRDIKEIYKSDNSWTSVLCKTGAITEPAPAGEAALLKRVHAFLHVDDHDRAQAYLRLLTDGAPAYENLVPADQAYARMLFFNLWDNAGGFTSFQQGLASLRFQPVFRDELRQVLSYVMEQYDHFPIPLSGPHSNIPLKVHSSYNRSEILAALGVARFGGQMPRSFAQGVQWVEDIKTDALLITLDKNEKDFSPTVRYKDYALSPTLFHWESQNATAESSPTGLRYQQHVQEGSHVLLFMRRYKDTDIGKAHPWMLLGPATYVEHTGSKPMAITWRLKHELPADVWTYSAITSG
ncbi:ATP-dependent RNA helicase SrmB [Streptomyces scabiei]|uniref:ATP-dependent RNA helicase SrmB n=2 Tax=Streptomyces scabiei TaxID=1930 RepID=A0A100JTW2_STRSC|nr:ATP-dependent RNA helicase SrmB [Streptomyces scabiei]